MPATVIDALVVTLGLDKSKFEQGSREADKGIKKTKESALKAGKDMEAAGKQAAVFFSKLRNEALMFVGVLAGAAGIKSFATNTIQGARALGFQSQALDMNIKRLQAWEKAARQAGATRADVDSQLKESQNAIGMTRRGLLAPGVQEFRLYGGQGDVQNMTPEQYLMARFAVIQRIARQHSVTDARLAAQQMGVSDGLFNFALQGNDKIDKQLSYFEKLSEFTQQDAKNANALTNQFNILGDRVQLLGVRVGTALMPYLQKLIDWFNSIAQWVDTHQDTITRWMNEAIAAVKGFWKEVDAAAKAVGGWKVVLGALLALKILQFLSPLGMLASLLWSVGRALGLISAASAAVGVLGSALGAVGTAGIALGLYPNRGIAGDEAGSVAALNRKTPQQVRDAQMRAVAFFQKKGLTREQAIGLVAGFTAESNMNPQEVGDNGSAVGIGQWHPMRQALFRKMYGFDIKNATLDQQLEFSWKELNSTERHALAGIMSAPNNQLASDAATNLYFRPSRANRARDLANRRGISGQLFGYMDSHVDPTRPVFPINAMNALNAATGKYTSTPITNSSSSEVNLNGPVTITTNATDAKGVVDGLKDYIRTNVLTMQTNTGLQ